MGGAVQDFRLVRFSLKVRQSLSLAYSRSSHKLIHEP